MEHTSNLFTSVANKDFAVSSDSLKKAVLGIVSNNVSTEIDRIKKEIGTEDDEDWSRKVNW